jgi:hypothetical protein
MLRVAEWCAAAAILALGILATPAHAQTVYNPIKVQFDSPDHAVTCPAANCVSGYRMELWLQGVDPATGQPVSSYDATKSKVTTTGSAPAYQILFSDFATLPAVPAGNMYVARLVAIGVDASTLSARSVASNPFALATAPRSLTNVQIK